MFDQFLKLFRGFTADNRRGYGSDSTGGIAISPKLARRERAVTAFLADLSHGLRTPLTGILVFSDLMKNESRGPLGDAKYAEYVTQIRDDSSHMLAIVDELPAMSRLDAGGDTADHPPTSVDAAIAAAARTVSPDNDSASDSTRGRIIRQVNGDLPMLRVGEADLRKMVYNLMDNALKHSRDQGPATVSARVDFRGGIVVTISDTGIDMLGSEVAVALSRFGRVDDDTVKTTAGTELGLPLTRALADRYDTRLEIHSEKGVGTVVNLRFPVDRVVTARTAAHRPKAVDAA